MQRRASDRGLTPSGLGDLEERLDGAHEVAGEPVRDCAGRADVRRSTTWVEIRAGRGRAGRRIVPGEIEHLRHGAVTMCDHGHAGRERLECSETECLGRARGEEDVRVTHDACDLVLRDVPVERGPVPGGSTRGAARERTGADDVEMHVVTTPDEQGRGVDREERRLLR